MSASSTKRQRIAAGLVLFTLLVGCAGSDHRKEESPEARLLQARLLRFSDYFSASISSAADEIASQSDDRLVWELMLRWKLRYIPAMQAVVANEDPRHAFIDAWMICVRQTLSIEDEQTRATLGDLQPIALGMSRRLEERIEQVGVGSLPVNKLDEARVELSALARGEPGTGRFDDVLLQASDRINKEAHPSVFRLLSIPIGGLSDTADAIKRIAVVGDVFTQVAQDLPERTRWQTQLLLLEATRRGAVKEALDDFDRLSHSVESFAETAKTLPAEVREEVEGLMTSTESTLGEARGLVGETRALLAEVEGPLESVRAMSAELRLTGNAWSSAGTAVDGAMQTIDHMGDDDPPSTPDDDSFKVSDLTDAGTSIQGAAVELRGILSDLESERFRSSLEDTDSAVTASIDLATTRLEALVGTLTLRALFLVVVFLAGSFVVHRYGPRKRET